MNYEPSVNIESDSSNLVALDLMNRRVFNTVSCVVWDSVAKESGDTTHEL